MTVEEAKSWCRAATKALPMHWTYPTINIERVEKLIYSSEPDRLLAADRMDWFVIHRERPEFTERLFAFCEAILRAVKT